MTNQNVAEGLKSILNHLKEDQNSPEYRKEAMEFLVSVNPAEMAMAEQKLVDAGLSLEDFGYLYVVHIDALKNDFEKIKNQLASGHVLKTFANEHETIMTFLDELEKINDEIQNQDSFNKESMEKLAGIASGLIESEPHHKREEDVLCPVLEKRGIMGPSQIIKTDHEDFRKRKQEIKNLANSDGENFQELKKKIENQTKALGLLLRYHIAKENGLLFPTLLQLVQDEGEWNEMKQACDKIGYCSFTKL